jgi:hypothetical protein
MQAHVDCSKSATSCHPTIVPRLSTQPAYQPRTRQRKRMGAKRCPMDGRAVRMCQCPFSQYWVGCDTREAAHPFAVLVPTGHPIGTSPVWAYRRSFAKKSSRMKRESIESKTRIA